MSQHTLTLKLKNYRRFAETGIITFQPGLTIISGQNGAGKSTLIEAFLYALYGPKLGPKSGQRADEIRTDSLSGPVRVECQLYIDDREIHIIREGTKAELRIDTVVQVQGGGGSSKAVTARVTALLGGLARKQFESTYVALQGDTAGLVVEDARQRREIIEKVLQMEVLTKAIELQATKSNENKGEVISLGKNIGETLYLDTETRELIPSFQRAYSANMQSQHTQTFLKKIEQFIIERQKEQREYEQESKQAQAAAEKIAEKRKNHQSTLVVAEQSYKKLGERKEKYEEYQTKIISVKAQIEQIEKDIRNYQSNLEEAEHYAEEAKEYNRLQTEIGNCARRLEQLPLIKRCYDVSIQAKNYLESLDCQLHELAKVEEELYEAKKQEEQARQNKETVSNTNPTQADDEALQRQRGGLDHEETQNRDALKQLGDGLNDAYCPTCNQLLAGHTREHRVQHLTLWFNETLPSLQEQLEQQQISVDRRRTEWKNKKKQAETIYAQCQTTVTTAEKKIVKRETLCEQREKDQPAFLEKQNAWLELSEKVPDPQEEATIQRRKEGLTKQSELLKDQADAYTQVPTHRKNLADKQQDHANQTREQADLLTQQRALGFDPEKFQAAKEYLDLLRVQEKEILEQVFQAEIELKDAQDVEQRTRQRVELAQAFHDRFRTGVQEYMRGERLREHLEEFKKHFFEANTEQVMKRTTELLLYAITDQSILGVKFAGDDFQYLDASHIAYPIGRLSGGEKSLVGLCLRIALAEQAQTIARMGRVKFLVLDEVLSSLDEERSESVKRIFADVLQRGIFEHIVMITHLDTVKQSWQADGLAVQKVDGKISTVISVSPGEIPLDLAEE